MNQARSHISDFGNNPQLEKILQIGVDLTTALVEIILVVVLWLVNIVITLTQIGGQIEKQTHLLGQGTQRNSA